MPDAAGVTAASYAMSNVGASTSAAGAAAEAVPHHSSSGCGSKAVLGSRRGTRSSSRRSISDHIRNGKGVLPLIGICKELSLLLLHWRKIRAIREMIQVRTSRKPYSGLHLCCHLHRYHLHNHYGTQNCIIIIGLDRTCIIQT